VTSRGGRLLSGEFLGEGYGSTQKKKASGREIRVGSQKRVYERIKRRTSSGSEGERGRSEGRGSIEESNCFKSALVPRSARTPLGVAREARKSPPSTMEARGKNFKLGTDLKKKRRTPRSTHMLTSTKVPEERKDRAFNNKLGKVKKASIKRAFNGGRGRRNSETVSTPGIIEAQQEAWGCEGRNSKEYTREGSGAKDKKLRLGNKIA